MAQQACFARPQLRNSIPGSASGEPLLPAPSGSCGGSASRGRARRRRRRRRGEGGRALPRGRDWRAACARGGGAAAAAPSQARERAPRKREPFARPRAPSVSGTRRRAAVETWNLSQAGCAQSPWGLFQPRKITPACGRPQGCCPPPARSAGGLREQRMLWVGAEGGPGGVSAISTCPPPRGSLGVPGCESLISTSVAVWFGIHILCFPETRG